MDQTQTRQTAAPPSHPSLLPHPHLSLLIFLSISFPFSSNIPSVYFSLFTLILSILSFEWIEMMMEQGREGDKQHKEKE